MPNISQVLFVKPLVQYSGTNMFLTTATDITFAGRVILCPDTLAAYLGNLTTGKKYMAYQNCVCWQMLHYAFSQRDSVTIFLPPRTNLQCQVAQILSQPHGAQM